MGLSNYVTLRVGWVLDEELVWKYIKEKYPGLKHDIEDVQLDHGNEEYKNWRLYLCTANNYDEPEDCGEFVLGLAAVESYNGPSYAMESVSLKEINDIASGIDLDYGKQLALKFGAAAKLVESGLQIITVGTMEV